MKKILLALFISLSLPLSASALDVVEKLFAEKLVYGGSSTIRDVASSMAAIKDLDNGIYDIAAEVLLRDYKSAQDKASVDAMSWITKALVASQDARYISVLEEVSANATNKKLRKYGKKTLSKLKKQKTKSSDPYKAGTAKLSSIKKGSGRGRGKNELGVLKVGMGASEAYDLVGTPTSESASVTGKAFNPFNYSGKGNVRTYGYYKGQGSIVFENTSSYSSGRRVVEIVIDAYESGHR